MSANYGTSDLEQRLRFLFIARPTQCGLFILRARRREMECGMSDVQPYWIQRVWSGSGRNLSPWGAVDPNVDIVRKTTTCCSWIAITPDAP